MKTQDLRIGNNVWFDSNGRHFHTITSKDLVVMEKAEKEFGFESECYTPIPLTEKWLLKMEFHYYLGRYYSKNGHVKFDTKMKVYCPHICIDIKYVHQLQNLYFALTGEELNINL